MIYNVTHCIGSKQITTVVSGRKNMINELRRYTSDENNGNVSIARRWSTDKDMYIPIAWRDFCKKRIIWVTC